jgi:hypothetical protein
MSLLTPFARKGELEFPIVKLTSMQRHTADPSFAIVGWVPRGDFGELVPPLEIEGPAPRTLLMLTKKDRVAIIDDDDIPF